MIIPTLASAAVLCAMALAQGVPQPYVNIDRYRHGNLAAAQGNIVQAFNYISYAQRANDGQLGGHAARAKELLTEANEELRLAADVATEHQDQQGPPLQNQQPPQ